MKVFISWSKPRSHEVAKAFAEFLPRVIQECQKPFVSSSIRKGDAWFGRIATELDEAQVGVVFITRENQREEWLNFECGAMLTRVGEQQLCPVLIGLPNLEYKGPLKNLQLTAFEDKEEMRKLVLDIHELSESTVSRDVISDTFDDRWDRFVAAATEGMAQHAANPRLDAEERDNDDKLDEALDMLRALTRESRRSREFPTSRSANPRAAWRYVRKYSNGEIDITQIAKQAHNLERDLSGEIVALKGGLEGKIVGVETTADSVNATMETKEGKLIILPLTDLLEKAQSLEPLDVNQKRTGSLGRRETESS